MTLTINPTEATQADADTVEEEAAEAVAPGSDQADTPVTDEVTPIKLPKTGKAFLELDPRRLLPPANNPRYSVENLRGLKASIKGLGVLEPLVITRNADGHAEVAAGARRQQAAILADQATVPCYRQDLGGAEVVLAALVENIHREDLTEAEVAEGYQLALDLGATPGRIARLTGTKPAEVRKALVVTASAPALEALKTTALTLDEAAAIAGFEDDPDAVAELVAEAGREWAFKHALSRLTSARQRKAEAAAKVEALVAEGVRVIPNPGSDEATAQAHPGAMRLSGLSLVEHGPAIDPDDHAACPGHAAVVSVHQPDRPEWWCLDPEANGHHTRTVDPGRPDGKPKTDAEKAAASSHRKLVIRNNQAIRDAQPVRHEYVQRLLAKKRPPKGGLRFAVEEIMRRPHRVGDASDTVLAQLTSSSSPTLVSQLGRSLVGKATTDASLQVVLLAQVAAAIETNIDERTWRDGANYEGSDSKAAARWFRFLATTGFELSEIEQYIADKYAPLPAPVTDEEASGNDGPSEDEAADDEEDQAPADDHPVDGRPSLRVIEGDANPDADEDPVPRGAPA